MICFENVTYAYPGEKPVLKDLSFTISKGERVGLIGANGAGKSTVMKAALGLVNCEGKISIDGMEMCRRNLSAIRKCVGYVLQDSDNQMFMPTVFEDMIFGPMNYGMSREEAERSVDEILDELELGYLKHRQNHKISGGEKRMAAIATILAMKPEYMLMDEPSTALDPQNRRVAEPDKNRLYILSNVDCPAILVECGFVSNHSDITKLTDSRYQTALSTVLMASYLQFIHSNLHI